MITDDSHYFALAAAYVRGVAGDRALDDVAAVERGERHGMRLHRFKRTGGLQRVRAVLGALRGFGATSIVDLGSGRGAFVWPLLDALPEVTITTTDLLPHRALLFSQVARGGVERLRSVRCDATALPLIDGAADCVTTLEVLEHMPGESPSVAAREAMRVARIAVIATVPSHEDDNPEHVQLFDGDRLAAMFRAAGARRVAIDHVLNHIVAVATK